MRNGIGYVLAEQSQLDEALEQLRAALAIRREVGDRAGEGGTLKNLGDVHLQLGQPTQALDCYLQAEVIAHEVGDRHREGQAQHGLGVALTELGRLDEAEKRLDQALMVRREVNDLPGEAAPGSGSPMFGVTRTATRRRRPSTKAALRSCAPSVTDTTRALCCGSWAWPPSVRVNT